MQQRAAATCWLQEMRANLTTQATFIILFEKADYTFWIWIKFSFPECLLHLVATESHDSCHVIFIVLLLSELHGSLGSFRLLIHVINGMFVSFLPSMVFSRGMRPGDFHPTLMIESNIFYGWNLPDVSVCVFKSGALCTFQGKQHSGRPHSLPHFIHSCHPFTGLVTLAC